MQHIFDLIHECINIQQFDTAERLMTKYATYFASIKEHDCYQLIKIHVRLNHIQEAWEIALKQKDADDLILYILRNAFLDCRLQEEVDKITPMLPAL